MEWTESGSVLSRLLYTRAWVPWNIMRGCPLSFSWHGCDVKGEARAAPLRTTESPDPSENPQSATNLHPVRDITVDFISQGSQDNRICNI